MNKNTVYIDSDMVQRLQDLLDGKARDDLKEGETLWQVSVPFVTDVSMPGYSPDDITAEIKVVQSRDSNPYVDPVLFHGCNEVGVGEPDDTLVGEYIFEYDGETYVAVIKDAKELIKEPAVKKPEYGISYRQLRDMLNQIPEDHLDDNVAIVVATDNDYEVHQALDFVTKWAEPQNNEEGMPVGDYSAQWIDQVEGVLDDDHPFLQLVLG